MRTRRVLIAERRLALAYVGSLACTALTFALVQLTHGLPQRFPVEVMRLAAFANDKSLPLAECEFSRRAAQLAVDRCRIGKVDTPPRWMVVGDSHAWAAHDAFDQWLRAKGEAGYFAFRNSCPPLRGLHVYKDHGECHSFNEAVGRFLDAQPEVRHVLLVSTWRQAVEGRLSASSEVRPTQSESLALFEARFASTIETLRAQGRQVYVWEPLPGALAPVPEALARAELEGRPPEGLTVSRDRYREENAAFFAALRRARPLLAASFSPAQTLCQSGRCLVAIDGRPLYFDSNHVTRSSAPVWVRMMQSSEVQPDRGPLVR